MPGQDFARLVSTTLDATPVGEFVRGGRRAVVLERIARGGGATDWYLLSDARDLDALAHRLRPGSRVSFYFDDRFAIGQIDRTRETLAEMIQRDGEIVVGALRIDSFEFDVDFPSTISEADEFVREHVEATLLVGAFPAADNDGVNAVTVVLPDADGVVRPHPH